MPKAKAKWRDSTSYSQGHAERKPRAFRISLGPFTFSVVWNHRDCPDTWSASLFNVFENKDLSIKRYEQRELALSAALAMAGMHLTEALQEIENASTTVVGEKMKTKLRTGFRDADGKPIVKGEYCKVPYKEPTGEIVEVNGEVTGRFPQRMLSVFLPDVGRRGVYYAVAPSKIHMRRSMRELVAMSSKNTKPEWFK